MVYEYTCEKCTLCTERYVPTFDQADDEVCECGAKLKRVISNTARVEVWDHTSIPEIDPNIHFRSYRHAKEVMRAKGLSSVMSDKSYEKLKPFDCEYAKKNEERLNRQPIVFDMARTRRATG